MLQPLPGTPLLSRTDGWQGELIWLLQVMNGVKSPWTHVALMVDDGLVFEAQYSGCKLTPWNEWMRHRPWVPVPVSLTDDERFDVCDEARGRLGTGYNWDGWFYLAAYRLRLPLTKRLIERMSQHGKLICSQVVDDIFRRVGVPLFNDQRLIYDVVPGHYTDLLI
jgi:hypothetical protein